MTDREKIIARVLMLDKSCIKDIKDVGILQTLLVHLIRDAQELVKCVNYQEAEIKEQKRAVLAAQDLPTIKWEA